MKTPYPANCPPDNQREMDDNNKLSNDHIVSSTLTFNLDDPDGERRLRECLDAPKWKSAVQEFDQALRNDIKYHGAGKDVQRIRDHLHVLFDEQGIDIWEE